MEAVDYCPYKVYYIRFCVPRATEALVGQNQHQLRVLVLVLWSVQLAAQKPLEENLILGFYLWTLSVQVHKRKRQTDKSAAALAS